MEAGSITLCDTNILIDFYKEEPGVIKNLRSIGQKNIAISIITAGELCFGALNKQELDHIRRDLKHLRILHINHHIGEKFTQLMFRYSLSHKLSLPDGFIAATAIVENIPLYTHNRKDFKFIKDIKFYDEK